MLRLFTCLFFGLSLLCHSAFAVSEADLLPVEKAYPISVKRTTNDEITVSWGIAKGYYLYRHRFAISAVDPSIKLGAMVLPAGNKHRDEFFGDVETYRQQVSARVRFENPHTLQRISLKIKYQGCADIGVCYPPQTKIMSVELPAAVASTGSVLGSALSAASTGSAANNILGVNEALPEDQAFQVEAIIQDDTHVLARLTPAPGYYLYQQKTQFEVLSGQSEITLGAAKFPSAQNYPDPEFGTVPVYFQQAEIPVELKRKTGNASEFTLRINYQGCKIDGICYPPMHKTFVLNAGKTLVRVPLANMVEIAPKGAPTNAISTEFIWVLFGALLGGLILNLMPCVLPVLSFKAMALAQASEAHLAKKQALWYSAGVLFSFAILGLLVLALRGAGQALGWGFQLQQPVVVGVLALLMFAIGLMMSGLYNLGSGFAGVGQSLTEKSGARGDFFTGVLAVVVASPCTAPFMGSALGYAFTAHWSLALLVFLALGFGLALPFLLIGFMPALATRLPKPGAWMESLKLWLAYPMYFTAVWLAWVFGNQKGVNGLGLLLIAGIFLGAALWWFEHQKLQPSIRKKFVVLVIAALAIGSFWFAVQQELPKSSAQPSVQNHEKFSTLRLQELRAQGIPVFVDMTADWCITCKVNEKAVLHTAEFKQLLKDTGTVYMIGDWTNQDAEITAFLDQFHSPGVPLYVIYTKDSGEGKKLPQLLSQKILREALNK